MFHAFETFAQAWAFDVMTSVSHYLYYAVGVWLLLWVALRWPLKSRKIRPDTPGRRQIATEVAVSVRSMAIFASVDILINLLDRWGAYPLPKIGASWGPVWFWTSLALMIIVHDTYIYWTHRLMHRPRLFRRFHLRHHRSSNPSPFTAYSFDLREAAVNVFFFVLWYAVTPTPWAVGPLFALHQIGRNTLLHSGYELMPAGPDGKPLFDFLTTTTHHDLHHGQAGYNYAAWFTWWDRWMGTEHPDYLARYAKAAWRPFGGVRGA
ncbi:MAG: sterol desaturase family protein [Caulobacterales bacterium]|jgi:sterol desaturase/sphingolipid hydroxylase (fatty acid hydroxylase superfamily)